MDDAGHYVRAAQSLLDRFQTKGEFKDLLAAETCVERAVRTLGPPPILHLPDLMDNASTAIIWG